MSGLVEPIVLGVSAGFGALALQYEAGVQTATCSEVGVAGAVSQQCAAELGFQLVHDCTTVGQTYPVGCPLESRLPACIYWDVPTAAWSSEGCTLQQASIDRVYCSCNHLTNFAGTFEARLERLSQVVGHTDDITVEEVRSSIHIVVGLAVILVLSFFCICIQLVVEAREKRSPHYILKHTKYGDEVEVLYSRVGKKGY